MHSKETNARYARKRSRAVKNARRHGARLDQYGRVVCPNHRAKKWINEVQRLWDKAMDYERDPRVKARALLRRAHSENSPVSHG